MRLVIKTDITDRDMFTYVTSSTYAIVCVTSTICDRFHFNLPHCDCMTSVFISKLIKILIDALTFCC